MENKSAFVTGGAGFVGSHLTSKLLKRGKTVIVYDNFSTGKREFLPSKHRGLKIVTADLLDAEYLKKTLLEFKPSVIYHLAAIHYVPYCNANPIETVMVNVAGTEAVLEACRNIEIEKFIFASSAAVYPIKDTLNFEDDPIFPCDIYGNTKYFGEHLVRTFHESTGVPCVVARLFNIYGPHETNPHVIPAILEQLQNGTEIQLGNLDPKRDYIYVDDVVDALIAIAENSSDSFEVFNVGTGEEYSVEELVDIVGKICELNIQIKQDEQRKRKSDRLHLVADISKIKNLIGWKPKFGIYKGLESLIKNEYSDLLNHQ